MADAQADFARLRDALTLIERIYYMEGWDAVARAATMNGIARTAQEGGDLAQYKRLFSRAALQDTTTSGKGN